MLEVVVGISERDERQRCAVQLPRPWPPDDDDGEHDDRPRRGRRPHPLTLARGRRRPRWGRRGEIRGAILKGRRLNCRTFTPLSINFFSVQWVHSSSVFCVLSVWRSLRSISVGPSLLPPQVASAKDGLNADICYTSLLLTMLAPLGTLNLIASNLAWASLVSLWDWDGRYF